MGRIPTINAEQADLAASAAACVVETHRRVSEWLKPGVTLAAIDTFIARTYEDLKCRSCFLGYKVGAGPPFPSHACLSVNECVVHGTAGYLTRPLVHGDLLKVDIGVYFGPGPVKWIGDAAWTYCFGTPSPQAKRLMDAGKACLKAGVETLRPGVELRAWAKAVQDVVEGQFGVKCVRNWGGHGIGQWKGESNRGLHLPPHILNHMPGPGESWAEQHERWEAGNLVAVEPMLGLTSGATVQKPAPGRARGLDWPVYIADGSLSAHYEHDVLVTAQGPRVLTAGLESLRDVID